MQLQLDGVAPVVAAQQRADCREHLVLHRDGHRGALTPRVRMPVAPAAPVRRSSVPPAPRAPWRRVPTGWWPRRPRPRRPRVPVPWCPPRLRTSARRASPGGPAPAVSRRRSRPHGCATSFVTSWSAAGLAVVGFAVVPLAAWAFAPPWPAVPVAGLDAGPTKACWAPVPAVVAAPVGAGAVTAVAGAPEAAVVTGPGSDRVAVRASGGPPAAVAAAAEPVAATTATAAAAAASGTTAGVGAASGSPSPDAGGATGVGSATRRPADSGRGLGGSSWRVGRSCAPRLAVAGPAGWLWPFAGVWLASTAPKEPCSLPWRRPPRGADVASTPAGCGHSGGQRHRGGRTHATAPVMAAWTLVT